jgi:hypothetical protein
MSLLLTLLATPVAYSLFDDLTNWWARMKGRVTKRNEYSGPVADNNLAPIAASNVSGND